jgi:flagellar basal-body rod protein FlgB
MAGIFDAVDHLGSAMTFHRSRHTVLAGNVANIDTPGFRPADLERNPVTTDTGLPMAATDEGHLGGAAGSDTHVTFDDGGALQGTDGNAVELERELAKIDANRVRYGVSSDLVSRRMALLKYAATDGR